MSEAPPPRGAPWLPWLLSAAVMFIRSLHADDPYSSEEISGVVTGPWWTVLSGGDTPVNPPLLWAVCNAVADGTHVIAVGRTLSVLASGLTALILTRHVLHRVGTGAAIGVAWGLAVASPLVVDGAAYRAYALAILVLSVHITEAMSLTRGAGSHARAWTTAALAAYLHYLTMPVLVCFWAVLAVHRRDVAGRLVSASACWLPTLLWILGPGNGRSGPVTEVPWFVAPMAALDLRDPYHIVGTPSWYAEVGRYLVLPVVLAIPWRPVDEEARILRGSLVLATVCMAALGWVFRVRTPAFMLLLPLLLLGAASLYGRGTRVQRRGLGLAWSAILLVLSIHASRLVTRLWDPETAIATIAAKGVVEVSVPNESDYWRLRFLADGGLRKGGEARCVDYQGVRVCPGTGPHPVTSGERAPGCERQLDGHRWVLWRCPPEG